VAARADGGVIQVALDRTREEDLLAGYRRSLWLVLGLALLACALAGYRIARRGLRPVWAIAAAAGRIRPSTLGERIADAGLPAELAALAGTLNGMLERLEESFARLGRFSADIAHELRTPVNNLRGEAEVVLGKPRSPEEYRDALGSCLEECVRLSRLIDRLLFLARAENPRAQVERERVDVGRELTAVRDFYEAAAGEVGVRLAVTAPAGLTAELDRQLLQRAIGNLVENALAHTPPGGTVTLTARRDDGALRVEVADTGCGVPAADLPRLFDRFFRVDRARMSERGGVGLGLPIVKSIAELHGGSVQIASEAGRGTRVTLRFPCPEAPASR
jgi:two-component system heavy metal sensor histidine kinase CusS